MIRAEKTIFLINDGAYDLIEVVIRPRIGCVIRFWLDAGGGHSGWEVAKKIYPATKVGRRAAIGAATRLYLRKMRAGERGYNP